MNYRALLLFSAVFAPAFAQLFPPGSISDATLDPSGAIYVAGVVNDSNLSTTQGAYQTTLPAATCGGAGSCSHAFLAKIASSGDRIVWATFFAGNGSETLTTLVRGTDGSLLIGGQTTSTDLLASVTGYRNTPASLYIARFSSDGRSLLGGTYFGGSGKDVLSKLRLDSMGKVYAVGTTVSADFPTTPGAYQRQPGTIPAGDLPAPGFCSGPQDAFVGAFDPGLRTLLFSTRSGTDWYESGEDLAIGADGSLYIAGAKGYPRTCQARATVTRLTVDGTTLISRFDTQALLGIDPPDIPAYAIAVGSDGSTFIGGDTRTFATSPTASGKVWKFDASGRLAGIQRVGGLIRRMLITSVGDLVVVGEVTSDSLQKTAGSPQPCLPPRGTPYGMSYYARLNSATLTPSYSGYLNGSGWLANTNQIVAMNAYTKRGFTVVAATGLPPAQTVTCIANAGSYDSGAISPGEIITLFGTQIGPAVAVNYRADGEGNLISELEGTRVLVNGMAAPLLYASPQQINLVVPFGLDGAAESAHFEIYRAGVLMEAFDKTVAASHPGLFSADASGTGFVAALNQDGSVNSPTNPASSGDIVSLFFTGAGAMTPTPKDGSRPDHIASQPILNPTVLVNGQSPEVLYMGNAPTLVEGLVQANIRLPVGLAAGTAIVSLYALYGAAGNIAVK